MVFPKKGSLFSRVTEQLSSQDPVPTPERSSRARRAEDSARGEAEGHSEGAEVLCLQRPKPRRRGGGRPRRSAAGDVASTGFHVASGVVDVEKPTRKELRESRLGARGRE